MSATKAEKRAKRGEFSSADLKLPKGWREAYRTGKPVGFDFTPHGPLWDAITALLPDTPPKVAQKSHSAISTL